MKIYFGKNKKESRQVSLRALLTSKLLESGFKLDNGSFEGESHAWVGVVQETKKPSQVLVNICFNDEDAITEVKVYETPIITTLDNDQSKQII